MNLRLVENPDERVEYEGDEVVYAESLRATGDDGIEVWATWERVAGILFNLCVNGKTVGSWQPSLELGIAYAEGYAAGAVAGRQRGAE